MSWTEPSSWDWATITKTVVGAGIGTALVQIAVPFLLANRARKANAAYLAMRLAAILEGYSLACQNFIAEHDAAERHPDHQYPDWNGSLPALPSYPDDADGWRALNKKLAQKCLTLRNRLSNSQNLIYWTREYVEDNLEYRIPMEAALLGLDAWRLASDLRRVHGVEGGDLDTSCGTDLAFALQKAETAKAEDEARNTRMSQRMMAKQ